MQQQHVRPVMMAVIISPTPACVCSIYLFIFIFFFPFINIIGFSIQFGRLTLYRKWYLNPPAGPPLKLAACLLVVVSKLP
jgi:hypothetical protein